MCTSVGVALLWWRLMWDGTQPGHRSSCFYEFADSPPSLEAIQGDAEGGWLDVPSMIQ